MFERHMKNFDRNRMYPPGCGKETAMSKPSTKHIDSITRCQQLLKSGLNTVVREQFSRDIEHDLRLLGEIKGMLYQILENPTLPFFETEGTPENGHKENTQSG